MRILAKISVIIIYMITGCALSAAQAPSAYDFMKPSQNRNLEISPSGRYIAFIQVETNSYCLDRYGQMRPKGTKCKAKEKDHRTTDQIAVYDLQDDKMIKLMPAPDNHYVGWLEFASDDRLLANIGTFTTIGRIGYSQGGSRVLSIPFTSTTEQPVFLFEGNETLLRTNRRLSRVTNMLRNDPDHVLMPARKNGDLDLWKVNIKTGMEQRVATGKDGTFFWYTSKNGKPVLRYDCSGRRCKKIKVYAPDSKTGEWEKIREVKLKEDEELRDSAFFPAALTDNENEVIVLADDDGDTKRSVKLYNLDTQTYTKTLYEHPQMDVGGVLVSNTTGDYLGAYLWEDRLTYVLEDETLQKHYNGINKYFDNEANISVVGYSKDGNQTLFYVTSFKSPGAYYLYNFNDQTIEHLMDIEPEIDEALDTDARILTIPTRDGAEITAYHYYPKGQQEGRPLLVMPHGGPHARDVFNYEMWVQYFVSRGYQVVQMNFRGSDGYGRRFEEAGYGEWGGLMLDDITDTTRYFHDNELAGPENTCIVGYSYGGYAALMSGAMSPELYTCVVSGAGISDLYRLLKDDKKVLDDETYEQLTESIALGDPKAQREMLERQSPINLIEKYEDPLLLIHGDLDGRVEYHHSEKMYKAMKKAGKSVSLVKLEDEGHSNWSLQTDILYLESLEAFLGQHLPPR